MWLTQPEANVKRAKTMRRLMAHLLRRPGVLSSRSRPLTKSCTFGTRAEARSPIATARSSTPSAAMVTPPRRTITRTCEPRATLVGAAKSTARRISPAARSRATVNPRGFSGAEVCASTTARVASMRSPSSILAPVERGRATIITRRRGANVACARLCPCRHEMASGTMPACGGTTQRTLTSRAVMDESVRAMSTTPRPAGNDASTLARTASPSSTAPLTEDHASAAMMIKVFI